MKTLPWRLELEPEKCDLELQTAANLWLKSPHFPRDYFPKIRKPALIFINEPPPHNPAQEEQSVLVGCADMKPEQKQIDIMKNKTKNTGNGGQEGREMNSELHELFLGELADLLNAETQLTKALPKMAKAAQSEELRDALESHLSETEGHVNRLKQVFESLDEKPKSKTCKAMKGLVEEGSELMQELKGSGAIDAGLIAAGQKVEHYEIASYGTVRAWAEQMGHTEAVSLLDETLAEEKAADEKLTEIAESVANPSAE